MVQEKNMPPRKSTPTKQTRKTPARARAPKLESFAPSADDLEIVRPSVDERVIKLEAASVGLGMAIVIVAALGYWYVFGTPIQATQPLVSSGVIEQANEAVSENYKITPAENAPVATDPVRALSPKDIKVAVFSTISVRGAAANLKLQLETAGFTVATIGNERPTLTSTSVKMKKSAQELADALRTVVEKKYAVTSVETLEETSPYDAVIMIGER